MEDTNNDDLQADMLREQMVHDHNRKHGKKHRIIEPPVKIGRKRKSVPPPIKMQSNNMAVQFKED